MLNIFENRCLRLIMVLFMILHGSLSMANKSATYQVDVIIFAHTNFTQFPENLPKIDTGNASSLQKNELLPPSASKLINEYYSLRNKPQYQILAHYSWIQPVNGKRTFLVSSPERNGWQMQGILTLVKKQYYQMDAKMVITTACEQGIGCEQASKGFLFTKKERLKAKNIYYLDHPGAGMLVRIQT